MAYTGLRIGECSALRVKNLDLDGLHVRVFEAFTDVKGKLVLGLPRVTRNALSTWCPIWSTNCEHT
ncbi:hypothetical protein [Nocardia asiatica]|uniref:hypothetical protein n=1 Tax=Nocardia asiatica TaxID=209252 RepID=UPI003EE3712A